MRSETDQPVADPVTQTRHFIGLDGLRGVAALVVAIQHSAWVIGYPLPRLTVLPTPFGLAVDFFFMLSGFVVAHAYEGRLVSGRISVGRLAAIRLIRLHPLLILGAVLGLTAELLLTTRHAHAVGGIGALLFAFVMSLLCLPFGRLPSSDAAFPLNNPQWSLFAEYLVNFVYAAIARHLGLWRLSILTLGSLAAFVLLALTHRDIFLGDLAANWPWGLVRVAFPFFAGVLLARLHHRGRLPSVSLPWPLLAGGLFALLLLAPSTRAVQLAAVVIVFPAILIFGRAAHFRPLPARALLYIGALSYPLYILHLPIVRLVGALVTNHVAAPAIAILGVQLAAAWGVAHIAFHWFDLPVRRWLTGRLRPPRPT